MVDVLSPPAGRPSAGPPADQTADRAALVPASGTVSIGWIAAAGTLMTVLVANVHLNHFYTNGAYYLDSAWFAWLSSHAVPPRFPNPPAWPGNFLATHVSPVFWIQTLISRTVFAPLNEVVRFSVFQGLWAAALAVGVHLTASRWFRGPMAAVVAVVSALNGITVAVLAFPHVELAIPAALSLALGLALRPSANLGSRSWIPAALALGVGLLVREDAGLHYFGVFAVAGTIAVLIGRPWLGRRLLAVGGLCALWAVLMVAGQKIGVDTGNNLLHTLYLGDPPYRHLSGSLLSERGGYLLVHKGFLWVPWVIGLVVMVRLRFWIGLAGHVSIIPWSLFLLTAKADNVGLFETYYAFPLIVYLLWPLFALALVEGDPAAETEAGRSVGRRRPSSLSLPVPVLPVGPKQVAALQVACCVVSTLLAFGPRAMDGRDHPLANAGFAWATSYGATNQAIDALTESIDDLGRFRVDDATATLLVDTVDHEQWQYWTTLADLDRAELDRIDTIVRFDDSPLDDVFRQLIADAGIHHHHRFEHTNLIVSTRTPRPDLVQHLPGLIEIGSTS